MNTLNKLQGNQGTTLKGLRTARKLFPSGVTDMSQEESFIVSLDA